MTNLLERIEALETVLARSNPEALAVIREMVKRLEVAGNSLSYALWQHEGNGHAMHNHWSGRAREGVAATDLTREWKP